MGNLKRVSDAAKELGVSMEHVRKQIRQGEWPSYELGSKARRLDVDEIREIGKIRAQAKREKGN